MIADQRLQISTGYVPTESGTATGIRIESGANGGLVDVLFHSPSVDRSDDVGSIQVGNREPTGRATRPKSGIRTMPPKSAL